MEKSNDLRIPEGYVKAEEFIIPDVLKKQITEIVEDYRRTLDKLVSSIDDNMKHVINSVVNHNLGLESKFGNKSIMSLDMVDNKITVFVEGNTESNTDDSDQNDNQESE